MAMLFNIQNEWMIKKLSMIKSRKKSRSIIINAFIYFQEHFTSSTSYISVFLVSRCWWYYRCFSEIVFGLAAVVRSRQSCGRWMLASAERTSLSNYFPINYFIFHIIPVFYLHLCFHPTWKYLSNFISFAKRRPVLRIVISIFLAALAALGLPWLVRFLHIHCYRFKAFRPSRPNRNPAKLIGVIDLTKKR